MQAAVQTVLADADFGGLVARGETEAAHVLTA